METGPKQNRMGVVGLTRAALSAGVRPLHRYAETVVRTLVRIKSNLAVLTALGLMCGVRAQAAFAVAAYQAAVMAETSLVSDWWTPHRRRGWEDNDDTSGP